MNTIKDATDAIILAQEAIKNDDLKTLKKAIKCLADFHDSYINYHYHFVYALYYKTLVKANNNDINAMLDIVEMTYKNKMLNEKALSYLERAEDIIKNDTEVDFKILYRLNNIYYKLDMLDKYDFSLSEEQNNYYFHDVCIDDAIKFAEKNNIYYIEKLIDEYKNEDKEKYLYYIQKLEKCIETIEDRPYFSASSAYKLYEEYEYVINDDKKARFYLEKAVKHEYKKAILTKACIVKDKKEKISLLSKILKMPYSEYEKDIIASARVSLVYIYYLDEKYKDYELAFKLIEEGVKNKEGFAYSHMAKFLYEGKCVEQDYKKSKYYAKLFMNNRIKKEGLEYVYNLLALEI